MSTNEVFAGPRASQEALKRLREGNARFCSGLRSVESLSSPMRIKELAQNGQRPFSVILACSDSRVPAETVFDCGLGDLFVIRVGGNVISPDVVASIEFAAASFDTPLCVVMGHTKCGVVDAAVAAELGHPIGPFSPHLRKLIEQVRPSAGTALRQFDSADKELISRHASVKNVLHGVNLIEEQSPTLRELIKENRFMITGALYDLSQGCVEFLERQPEVHMASLEPFREAWSQGR